MRKAGSQLIELNCTTEAEFLEIGQKLQDYYGRAKEIAGLSSSVAGLLFGTQMSDIMDRTRELKSHLQQIEDNSSRGTAILQGICGTIRSVGSQLNGFYKIVMQLRMLCLTIKVESARLNDQSLSFDILASDVGKLALEIENKCDSLDEWVRKLGMLIQKTLQQVLGLETSLQRQSKVIVDKTMGNLESLKAQHQLATAGAEQLAKRYESVSRSIAEVITSLQFHDITRQQIEHVKQALDQLASELDDQGSRLSRFRRGFWNKIRSAAQVCRLQRAQLVCAGDELIGATKRIIDNLRGVARNVSEMTTETQTLVGKTGEAEGSLLDGIEHGFSSLSEALANHDKASRELADTTHSVGNALEQMSAFAADIEAIGLKIKLVSLNAIVKAAQIGEEGASLAVLAEGIHGLSIETCQQTDIQSGTLRSIATASSELDHSTSSDDDLSSGADSIAEEMEAVLRSLRELNANIMSMQSRIEDAGRKLSDEIEKSVSLVTVHEKVQKVSDDIIAELDNRAYRLASLLPELPVSERSQDLESLESAYTMETERQIHESLSRANRSQIIEKEAAAHNPEEPSFFTDSHEAVLTELCVGDASQPTNRQEKVGAEKAAEFDENVEFF
jgi:methyl-accepting chemotaxis protein